MERLERTDDPQSGVHFTCNSILTRYGLLSYVFGGSDGCKTLMPIYLWLSSNFCIDCRYKGDQGGQIVSGYGLIAVTIELDLTLVANAVIKRIILR